MIGAKHAMTPRGDDPIAPDYYYGLTRLRSFALACSRERGVAQIEGLLS